MGTTDANVDGAADGERSDANVDGVGGEDRRRSAASDERVGDGFRSDAVGWLRGRVLDLLVVTGWTLGLALLFLETGWPRWAFYATVLGGAIWFAVALAPGAVRASGDTDQESAGESSGSGGD